MRAKRFNGSWQRCCNSVWETATSWKLHHSLWADLRCYGLLQSPLTLSLMSISLFGMAKRPSLHRIAVKVLVPPSGLAYGTVQTSQGVSAASDVPCSLPLCL